ncbi:putative secreted protein (Por secretion system target) [Flavobacterium sp. 90]|uniref:T9SS type A sorting domain-containing protein n=1 Tax=unclassified Flavobacterium TaxID=196869 RepID=UPI000EAEEEED|nr:MULTISPECIES: T9SS type A sorting domain-containing protein [unclassified Flavobacterium]RKR08774.1 putative secreted protein (Por secretion system target) [Flavobacterium sp. 81]TCK52561.1 putative secreted protein (Por secretion system target) [Flavobacterium sp. 90]
MKKTLYFLFTIILTSSIYSQNLKSITYESWSNNNWINSSYVIKNYDKSDKITDDLSQRWDVSSSTWKDFNSTNYEYNTNNLVDKIIYKSFDKTSNLLTFSQRASFSYINENKIDVLFYEEWTNNAWQNSSKNTSSYDSNGYLVSGLIQRWNENNWKNNIKVDYSNNSDGLFTQITRQKWNDSSSKWENFSQSTYTYNSSKQVSVETMNIWENNKWIEKIIFTNSYDANGFLVNRLRQDWDDDLSIWINQYQSKYDNNQNGTIHQEIAEIWNKSSNSWENLSRITYKYDKNLGIADLTKSQIKIFPNPTTDFINVHLEESNDTKVSIIDALGSVILKENFVGNDFSVNVMNLNKNVYFIKLENGEKTQVKKFIKN